LPRAGSGTGQPAAIVAFIHPREKQSMLKVYGIVASRALRTLWMCAELGIPHQLVVTELKTGAHKTPEYLALNPNGHIPAIDDDGFILYESMAINLYLAVKHKDKGLWPASLQEQALCYQWSFWVMMECEAHAIKVLFNRFLYPPEKRDEAKAAEGVEALQKPFAVLDRTLKGRTALVGNTFSVADLNVAAVLSWARVSKVDLAAFPNLDTWLGACLGRAAFKDARSKQAA
jgi:glutathione S-transferase